MRQDNSYLRLRYPVRRVHFLRNSASFTLLLSPVRRCFTLPLRVAHHVPLYPAVRLLFHRVQPCVYRSGFQSSIPPTLTADRDRKSVGEQCADFARRDSRTKVGPATITRETMHDVECLREQSRSNERGSEKRARLRTIVLLCPTRSNFRPVSVLCTTFSHRIISYFY